MTAPLAPEALDAAALSALLGSGPFDPEQELTFEQVEGSAHVWRVRRTPAVPHAGRPAPPNSLIVKFPPADDGVRAFKERLGLPAVEHALHGPDGVQGTELLRLPGLHGGGPAAVGVLVLDDMADGTLPPRPALSADDSERAVRALASFHARWWDRIPDAWQWLPDEAAPARANFLVGTFGSAGLSALAEAEWLPTEVRHGSARLAERAPALLRALSAPPLTVVHGDLHPANILFPADPAEPGIRVIDWEAATRSRGPVDLAFLIANSEADEDLELLDLYRRELAATVPGITADGLLRDYRRALLYYYLRRVALRAAYAGVPDDPAMRRVTAALVRHRAFDELDAL
ncbi:phosphotransferase [Streptomyces sp. BE230]|uniref:phosphotransferase n=1 Tax=Streptomyces sp. BE230 TaxID=3002526 RepID=UPI002ED5C829|nr:phosphotransferase [Streptomyces sp. BE230]